MKNIRNIIMALCVGGLGYIGTELIHPAKRQYYQDLYGTRLPANEKTDYYDSSLNWLGVGVAVCLAGIIYVLQPFRSKV